MCKHVKQLSSACAPRTHTLHHITLCTHFFFSHTLLDPGEIVSQTQTASCFKRLAMFDSRAYPSLPRLVPPPSKPLILSCWQSLMVKCPLSSHHKQAPKWGHCNAVISVALLQTHQLHQLLFSGRRQEKETEAMRQTRTQRIGKIGA